MSVTGHEVVTTSQGCDRGLTGCLSLPQSQVPHPADKRLLQAFNFNSNVTGLGLSLSFSVSQFTLESLDGGGEVLCKKNMEIPLERFSSGYHGLQK